MSIKQDTAKKVVEEFQGGAEINTICADHQLPLITVCRVLVAAGEEPPTLDIPDGKRNGRHAKRNAEIVALHTAGFSYKSLAEEFGLSDGRIGDLCREAKKANEEQPATA